MNRIGLSRESFKLFIDTIKLLKLSRRRRRCLLGGKLNNLFQHCYWRGRVCVDTATAFYLCADRIRGQCNAFSILY